MTRRAARRKPPLVTPLIEQAGLALRKEGAAPSLDPAEVVMVALKTISPDWWRYMKGNVERLEPTSVPVMHILDAIRQAGFEIVVRGSKD